MRYVLSKKSQLLPPSLDVAKSNIQKMASILGDVYSGMVEESKTERGEGGSPILSRLKTLASALAKATGALDPAGLSDVTQPLPVVGMMSKPEAVSAIRKALIKASRLGIYDPKDMPRDMIDVIRVISKVPEKEVTRLNFIGLGRPDYAEYYSGVGRKYISQVNPKGKARKFMIAPGFDVMPKAGDVARAALHEIGHSRQELMFPETYEIEHRLQKSLDKYNSTIETAVQWLTETRLKKWGIDIPSFKVDPAIYRNRDVLRELADRYKNVSLGGAEVAFDSFIYDLVSNYEWLLKP